MAHAPSQYENNENVVDAKTFLEQQELLIPMPKKSKLEHAVVKGTPILVAAAIATGCAYAAFNDPETKQIFPTCGFYAATGMYCPGCGMTRAVGNLVQGDVLRAFRFNAMLVVAIPILLYLYIWWTTWAFSGRELPTLKFSKPIIYLIVAFVVIFSIGRNIPGAIPEFFSLGRI